MDSQQKSTEGITSITVSYYADIYLDEEWSDMKWDIIDAISYTSPGDEGIIAESKAFVVEGDEENYYFCVNIVYSSPTDIVIQDVFEIDSDMFLDFVNDNLWIKPYQQTC